MKYTLLLISLLLIAGCRTSDSNQNSHAMVEKEIKPIEHLQKENMRGIAEFVNFSKLNTIYRFNGFIPRGYKVEYIAENESINIYDPRTAGETNLEKSQIFIRHFSANSFLTLPTVDILERKKTNIGHHDAVTYTIQKKANAQNFSNQPSWRNEKHSLIDIRFTNNNPSEFYVFSYNPEFGVEAFEDFISELTFHNDRADISQPITQAQKRITLKPFGLQVSPKNSPVDPERFNGFHTGIDFEAFDSEAERDVRVYTICSGKIVQKEWIKGYGGMIGQTCVLEDQPIAVVYGHVDVGNAIANVGDYISSGTHIANLGDGFSTETDGERKHLHLGIYKGSRIILSGYVPQSRRLGEWIDFTTLLEK